MQALIQHAGTMFLLDEIVEWDEGGISCLASSHREPGHPLRRAQALSAVHLIEYGAQAMALHHGLLAEAAGEPILPGWLVSVKDVKFELAGVDTVASPLLVKARRLLALSGSVVYEFSVQASGTVIATGRIAAISAPAS